MPPSGALPRAADSFAARSATTASAAGTAGMADDTLPRLEAEAPRAWDVGLGTDEEIVLTALAPDGCIAFTNYKSEQVSRWVGDLL